MSILRQFIIWLIVHSRLSTGDLAGKSDEFNDSEELQRWIDEFEELQSEPPSPVLEEHLRRLTEGDANDESTTQEIQLYNHSAEAKNMKQYWWELVEEAPDYPDEPHIKAGMNTGETKAWPEPTVSETTQKTVFRFTQFKHRIPSKLINNRRHSN